MTTRTDPHRPSAIQPDDYVEVAFLPNIDGDPLGLLAFIESERRHLRDHMERTGGTWARHGHGGSCHVCGAWALNMVVFYHAKTNTYIKTGETCAEKMHFSRGEEFSAFSKKVRQALEAQAGKAKAMAILDAAGLERAWEIYAAPHGDVPGFDKMYWAEVPYEERTITDIVAKLIKYGSISDKATEYVRSLLARIDNRAAVEAAQAAEREAAQDAPVTNERIQISGVVVSERWDDTPFGMAHKVLVKTEAGWKAWGTAPGSISVEKGDTISFMARFERSETDSKFGFFSRPTKAAKLSATGE